MFDSLEMFLEVSGRPKQRYPLNPEPWGDPMELAHHLRQYQVQARPGDPTSPFIWGVFALMMVCGGHVNPLKHDNLKGVKGTVHKVFGGPSKQEIEAPPPFLSNSVTTAILLSRMVVSGFTWEEAMETMERHPEAGGAYWTHMQQWPTFDEDLWFEDAHNVRKPVPCEVSPLSEPLNINACSKVFEGTRLPEPMDERNYIEFEILGKKPIKMYLDNFPKLLKFLEQQMNPSSKWATPWVTKDEDHLPVASPTVLTNQILENGLKTLHGFARNGYLPWLAEQGALISFARSELRRAVPQATGNCPPDVGYRLNPDFDLEAMYLTYFGELPESKAKHLDNVCGHFTNSKICLCRLSAKITSIQGV